MKTEIEILNKLEELRTDPRLKFVTNSNWDITCIRVLTVRIETLEWVLGQGRTMRRFKAWDKLNLKWLDLFEILLAKDGSVLVLNDLVGEVYGPHQVKVVESTGLSDKNGKEIYEGDVLHFCTEWNPPNVFRSFNAVVEWQDGGFWFRGLDLNITDCNWHLYNSDGEENFYEVIGNIYENPELLQETVPQSPE